MPMVVPQYTLEFSPPHCIMPNVDIKVIVMSEGKRQGHFFIFCCTLILSGAVLMQPYYYLSLTLIAKQYRMYVIKFDKI